MAVTPISVSPSLASVLNAAGDRNNVDFTYLLQTAERESSLNPQAKAPTSSATGLFQFLDTTWLQVMKSEGPRLGYQRYADAITENADGEYVIKNPKLRAEVLKLREDPAVAADMAAAFTKSNGDYLKDKFGRMPSPGELYIAHFLGAQGAEKMFDAGLKDPDQIAATLFPREAAANKTIFYDHGQARTIRQVYKALVAQHEGPAALHPGYAVQQLVAEQQAAAPPVPLAPIRDSAGQEAMTDAAQPVPLAPIQQSPGAETTTAAQATAVSPERQAVPSVAPQTPGTAQSMPPIAAQGQPAPGQHYFVIERPVASPQQLTEGNSRRVTTNVADSPEIPSRIGPGNMSFTSLFSTEPDAALKSPLQPVEEGQGAFFAQLYGQ